MTWIILFSVIVLPLLIWGISALFSREQRLTGHATVVSHRVAQRAEMPKEDARYVGNWNYLVTFSLSDGEEIELYTIQEDFRALNDGTSGTLVWETKRLIQFEPDT